MEIIDTHCHLDIEAFDHDRDDVLQRCALAGVRRIIVPGIIARTWDTLLYTCMKTPGLYPCIGLHPVYLADHCLADLDKMASVIEEKNPLAVGEIGLDYYITSLDRIEQQNLFEQQLEIAQHYKLPVILHVRKSHDAILSTLRRIRVVGGICHAFNGSQQQASQYIELGFKLGFGGMITYQKSQKLRRLAKDLPLESLVLETDAPDMSGAMHHGERNSPEYLPEYLAELAILRGMSLEELALQTTRNAETVFDFSGSQWSA